ncbi:MAG: glycine zipper domain-containing protein [Verrucomicrobiales bacterium]
MKLHGVLTTTAAAVGLTLTAVSCTPTEEGAFVGGALGAGVGGAVTDSATGAVVGGLLGAATGAAIADDRRHRYGRYGYRGRSHHYYHRRPVYHRRPIYHTRRGPRGWHY